VLRADGGNLINETGCIDRDTARKIAAGTNQEDAIDIGDTDCHTTQM